MVTGISPEGGGLPALPSQDTALPHRDWESGTADLQWRAATVNGLSGFVMREQDGALDTIPFESCDGRIVAIYVVRNPDKLRHVRF
jgi:hypothetical protein